MHRRPPVLEACVLVAAILFIAFIVVAGANLADKPVPTIAMRTR